MDHEQLLYVLGLAALLLLSLLLIGRRRRVVRRWSRDLRLCTGRRQLLDEELARVEDALASFDVAGLELLVVAAARSLDELHVAVTERQAHLLNCEDLVNLQQLKLEALEYGFRQDVASRDPRARPPAGREEPPAPRKRSHLEDQLLGQIGRRQTGRRPRRD